MGKQLEKINLKERKIYTKINGKYYELKGSLKEEILKGKTKRMKLKKYDLVNTHQENCTGEDRENISSDERYGLGESSDYSEY